MKSIDFPRLLEDVQGYMAEKYSSLLETPKKNKDQLLSYIRQYVLEHHLAEEKEISHLADMLYQEMAEYSFLTPYLNGTNVDWEEININRWDDTKITFSDGSIKISPQQFFSPSHANDIITKLLRESGTILNPSKPLVNKFMKGY